MVQMLDYPLCLKCSEIVYIHLLMNENQTKKKIIIIKRINFSSGAWTLKCAVFFFVTFINITVRDLIILNLEKPTSSINSILYQHYSELFKGQIFLRE